MTRFLSRGDKCHMTIVVTLHLVAGYTVLSNPFYRVCEKLGKIADSAVFTLTVIMQFSPPRIG